MRTGSNIRQRADGRFEARYAKGRDKDGRIIYGCCYGKTYEEAARKREEAKKQIRPVREIFEELYSQNRAVLEATNREWQ